MTRPPLPALLSSTARGAINEGVRLAFMLLTIAALALLTVAVLGWLAFPSGPTVQP